MKQNIVLGNRAYCSVYYEDGGIFLNSQIAVNGMLLAENLEDFEFIQIEEEETQDCFALEVFGDHAVRIAKPLGAVKPPKAVKRQEVKIPAATIIINDSCGLSADAVVHALNELADDHTKIIYLMLSNVDETLFIHLAEEYLDQLTVVTSADILRQGGMDIRCGLSWESTAKDLLWEVLAHKHFVKLIKKCDLVVRLGLEGAVWFSPERKNSLTLVFRPDCIENDICRNTRGMMPGLDEMFAKELSASVTAESIIKAVAAVFSYYINGYTIEEQAVSYNDSVIIPPLSVVDIPFGRLSNQTEGWSLAACQAEVKMESIAEDIVFKGLGALKEVPSVTFGALTTIDRSEIERFRIIRNLFEEYLKNPKPARTVMHRRIRHTRIWQVFRRSAGRKSGGQGTDRKNHI